MVEMTDHPCLADLAAHERAVVVDVSACGEECQRLAALGIAPGCPIQMLCPGRTCLVKAGSSRFSLRGEHTKSIRVLRIA